MRHRHATTATEDFGIGLDDLAVPVFVHDLDGHLFAVNAAACRSLGYERDELLRLSLADIDRRWNPAPLHPFWRDGGGTVIGIEGLHRRKDGTTLPVEISTCIRPGPAGMMAVAVTHDLSAWRRSEALLGSLLDNVTDVYYRTDRHGRILDISRSITDLLGFTPDEVIGRDVRTFYVNSEERQRLLAATDLRGGRMTGYDVELRRKDGSTVWVSVSARRLDEEAGAGLEGFLRDVTDRHLAELRQRENREVVQALLNATTDATMLIARDGTLLACNTVFADRFGLPVEQCLGRDLFSMFPPEVAPRRRQACEEALATGRPVRLADRRNGRDFDNTVTPIPNADGVMDRVAIFSRDVTDDLAARAAVARHLAELERSNADLEQFAYVASHDLREPLRLVANYVSLLERRYGHLLDQDAHDFIAYARDGARRMDRLILDLLDYGRVSRADVAHGVVPLHAAVAEAEANLRFTAQAAQGEIETKVPPELRVWGDLSQLVRLVQNLIGNGLKYRAEERAPRVVVSAAADGAWVVLRVSDNGIGIEPAYFDRIFRIFQRLHPSHRYDGTGIGLAICRRIVERHGGTITVESVPGEGSTFTVRLPAAT